MKPQEINSTEYFARQFVKPNFPLPNKYTQSLPFDKQFPWNIFERLIARFAAKSYTDVRLYLAQGFKQEGIDIYCFDEKIKINVVESSLENVYIQCKRVDSFSAKKLEAATTEFLKGSFSKNAKRFIIAISQSIQSNKSLNNENIKQKNRLFKKGIVFELWDLDRLNTELRNCPEIVSEFFDAQGEHTWVNYFCDPEKINEWKKTIVELPDKKSTEPVKNFIRRRITTQGEINKWSTVFRSNYERYYLEDIIRKDVAKKVIILSIAGAGKSGELKNANNIFSNPSEAFYPILCYFKNYVDQEIEDFIAATEKRWLDIPEPMRLILLDGFDEIQTNKFETATRKLNLFSSKYPNTKIIITSRSNFYKGELDNFKMFYLENLTDEEVSAYLKKTLPPHDDTKFLRLARKNKVAHLLTNAFNLVELVKLYLANDGKGFPKNRSEAFSQLIEIKISANQKQHSLPNVHELDYLPKMRQALNKLSIVMEQLGINNLPSEKYAQVITDSDQRDLLKHSPLIHNTAKENTDWQFEHNNYQEYLAANVLSKQPLDVIKEITAFQPDFEKIKPKWVNTISFLIGLLSNQDIEKYNQLIKWLIAIDCEIFVKFERDIISVDVRVNILKSIFDFYKSKDLYLASESLRFVELADFSGSSKSFINYLLSEIQSANTVNHLCNVLNTLKQCSSFHDLENKIRTKLLNIIKSKHPAYIHSAAVECLFKVEIDTAKDEIDEIINSCPNINSPSVREVIHEELIKP